MHSRTLIVALPVALLCASFASAEDNPNKLSLGLSYLATSGNSSSQTTGIDGLYKHDFSPWGLEVKADYLRAESNGTLTAKKLFAGVRGTWALDADFALFLAASYLQDTFAGLDPRLLAAGGVTYKFLKGPEHELAFDGGLTWTKDDLVGDGSTSYVGALAAARYAWNINKTAKLTEDLAFYPSFKQGSNWRIESQTGLQAAVSTAVALKLSYGFRYANLPVAGFGKTDTQTAVSLVINFL
ncbi:MAG: YdiY family protein [Thermoanaerobaculales bacterium]